MQNHPPPQYTDIIEEDIEKLLKNDAPQCDVVAVLLAIVEKRAVNHF